MERKDSFPSGEWLLACLLRQRQETCKLQTSLDFAPVGQSPLRQSNGRGSDPASSGDPTNLRDQPKVPERTKLQIEEHKKCAIFSHHTFLIELPIINTKSSRKLSHFV